MIAARYACALLTAALVTVGAAHADKDKDEGKGKGKPKDATPGTIQIDLTKLPPDLAKALLKFAESQGKPTEKKPAPVPEKKPVPAPEKKPEVAKGNFTLPPGLAKKPKDHPGRTHYIEHVLKMKGAGAPSKGAPSVPPGKKKDKTDFDDNYFE